MTKTLTHLARTGVAAAALATFATGAHAALVASPNGDPFPQGSLVTLTPEAPFQTPFGWVRGIELSGFEDSPSIQPNKPASGDYRYRYFETVFSNIFWSAATGGTQTGYYQGAIDAVGFTVEVYARGSLTATGPFIARITSATFNGDVFNMSDALLGTLTTQVSESLPTTGTATYTTVNGKLYVETSFDVQGQFEGRNPDNQCLDQDGDVIDCPAFADVPLDGDSNPPVVPVPATAALLLPGLLGLRALRRRRTAAAA